MPDIFLLTGSVIDQDYYQLLKKNIDPVEWNSYVEGLVDEIRRRSRWDNISVPGKIYITEKWWDRLLDLVSGAKHLSLHPAL